LERGGEDWCCGVVVVVDFGDVFAGRCADDAAGALDDQAVVGDRAGEEEGVEGTLANWVNKDIERRLPSDGGVSESERDELARLRRENAEQEMERDVLKRSVVGWVKGGDEVAVAAFISHREDRARRAARGVLPGARGVGVLVLQVERPAANHRPARREIDRHRTPSMPYLVTYRTRVDHCP
jgi:transposase-like protein